MQQGNAEALEEARKLEGEEMTEKQLEMRRRINGMRCETETVRLFCFWEAFSNPQICGFLSFLNKTHPEMLLLNNLH